MKSPFPGMDPYLEHYWRDVHHRLITYTAEQLQPELPNDLLARIEERVFVESEEGGTRRLYPDVYVAEYPVSPSASRQAEGGVALAEPVVVTLSGEPVSQAYLEIREAGSGNRVITVIEYVSPTNKLPGQGRDLYLQKQQECLAARVNLVEVDLVRRGDWVVSVGPGFFPPKTRALYRACVRRGATPLRAELYPFSLQERLPAIPIPLRPTDSDAKLDLQTILDRCYQIGRYELTLNYTKDPDPPLEPADATWANELLHEAGRR